jgi:hypothetical protein
VKALAFHGIFSGDRNCITKHYPCAGPIWLSVKRLTNLAGIRRNKPRKAPIGSLVKLRNYFDEFHGERTINARKQTVADCYHGTVIRALRAAFRNERQVLKSREVDLTVITSDRAYLFEAKTSTTSQHIYTAIGQLTSHTPVVAKHAKPLPVTKVIVLPGRPNERYTQLLTSTLDIRIVTFRRSANGRITIKGLDALPRQSA